MKDLYSRNATFCNGARVDLTPLFDGDVLTVNGINIQVSIQFWDNGLQATGAEPDRNIRMVYGLPVEIGRDRYYDVECEKRPAGGSRLACCCTRGTPSLEAAAL